MSYKSSSLPQTYEKAGAEDVLFDLLKDKADQVSVGDLLQTITDSGLRLDDPRLRGLEAALSRRGSSCGEPGLDKVTLGREEFGNAIADYTQVLTRVVKQQLVIPAFGEFSNNVLNIYDACAANDAGETCCAVPQLASANPGHWGVSVCTIDGQRLSIGDVLEPFTLQATCRPLIYGMVLEHQGEDVVHQFVGREPSDRYSTELVLDQTHKPHNPLTTAGAIMMSSLLQAIIRPKLTPSEKFEFVCRYLQCLSGDGHISFNNGVFMAQKTRGDRCYALGYYMREFGGFPRRAALMEFLDLHFEMCATEMTCDSMSVMAATLANGGICPTTNHKVLSAQSVDDVLALTYSCGMYDYSGKFAFEVGLPATSGVSGAMLVVVPNVMGICTWSPLLDTAGTSCRGVQFCRELVRLYNFHQYDTLRRSGEKINPRRSCCEVDGAEVFQLLKAASADNVQFLRAMRLRGCDMAQTNYDGRTALHVAARSGALSSVRFLVERCGVPKNVRDRWGRMPLDVAVAEGHQNVVRYLRGRRQAVEGSV